MKKLMIPAMACLALLATSCTTAPDGRHKGPLNRECEAKCSAMGQKIDNQNSTETGTCVCQPDLRTV